MQFGSWKCGLSESEVVSRFVVILDCSGKRIFPAMKILWMRQKAMFFLLFTFGGGCSKKIVHPQCGETWAQPILSLIWMSFGRFKVVRVSMRSFEKVVVDKMLDLPLPRSYWTFPVVCWAHNEMISLSKAFTRPEPLSQVIYLAQCSGHEWLHLGYRCNSGSNSLVDLAPHTLSFSLSPSLFLSLSLSLSMHLTQQTWRSWQVPICCMRRNVETTLLQFLSAAFACGGLW